MAEQHYFASIENSEMEFSRLRLLEEIYDPVSIRHLEAIQVSKGWNCLEVGAGAGSVARWLATRVGPTGKVVATDIDLRFLHRVNLPNVEIRQHDILKDDLETGQYDLVHCRLLLMHLSEPEKGLKRMAKALRPGGCLLIEEDDHGSVLSTDIINPSAVTFTSVYRAGTDLIRKRGVFDPYFGRRVRGLVKELGFIELGHDGWTCIIRGSDPFARLLSMDIQALKKFVIPAGLITQEQFDIFQRQLLDPDFYYLGLTLFAAWGSNPINKTLST